MANLDTFEDIITDIKDRFDDQSSSTDTSARRWTSQVLMDIWSKRKWKFARKIGTITTVASQENYSLASDYDFGGVYDVYDTTNDFKLFPVQNQQFDLVYPNPSTTGKPQFYRLWDVDADNIQVIRLYPIPAGVYTVKYKYYRVPSNMTTGTETPPLPNKYRELLVLGPLAMLFEKDQNPQANIQWAKYNQKLNQMISDYAEEPGDLDIMQSEDYFKSNLPIIQYPSNYPDLY